MARYSAKDNADLIKHLQDRDVIKTLSVAKIMRATDRRFYATQNYYIDAPQPIACGVTISAPHMHAYVLELVKDKLVPHARVLDIGSGSGYLTACFARLLDSNGIMHDGLVVGIDYQPELVHLGKKNIISDDPSLISSGRIQIMEGDGRLGYKEYAPYDVIHVGAASPDIPHNLINQLKPNGRLIVPVGKQGGSQYLEQYDKTENGEVSNTRLMSVLYGPLVDVK